MVFSWGMAEELAAAHMVSLGIVDARRTPPGSDGGIDVTSEFAVAQVKYLSRPVGSPDVQRLKGAAHGRALALFYTNAGYSNSALAAAETLDVALFTYNEANEVSALNDAAQKIANGILDLIENAQDSLRTLRTKNSFVRKTFNQTLLFCRANPEKIGSAQLTTLTAGMEMYRTFTSTVADDLTLQNLPGMLTATINAESAIYRLLDALGLTLQQVAQFRDDASALVGDESPAV